VFGSEGGRTRELGLLGIYSKRLFDHRAEFVVWRAEIWQNFD
jgi:hypothetical protein